MRKSFSFSSSRTANILAALSLTFGVVSSSTVNAAPRTEVCTFSTAAAHFSQMFPEEKIAFSWVRPIDNSAPGRVTKFQWQHGALPVFEFAAAPGSVVREGYYDRFELGITDAGHLNTRYTLKGYIAPNITLTNVTLAGIYEGTGSAWLTAYGTLQCNAQ